MGIFGGKNRVKSQSSTTTLIAEGCTVNGHIKVENRLQIDGYVEGHVEAMNQLKISESGFVKGEIITDRLIINGTFEGVCHATYIEILSCGRVSGTVHSDNLSIEPGGKFMGVTTPSDEQEEDIALEKEILPEQSNTSEIEFSSKTEDSYDYNNDLESDLTNKVTLLSNDAR